MADKVFCDPVHRHIVFNKSGDRVLLDLLACPALQRLRRIHQLGVSLFTYPGAEHSRFGHALGACHVMTQALASLNRNQPEVTLDDEVALAARCAALLHDIGHGPYSHLTERLFEVKHEARTAAIIREDPRVNGALKKVSDDFPDLVVSLLHRDKPEYQFLSDLLDSHLDVDRMDFVLRDAHFCGVPFGAYDYLRILHTLRVEEFPYDKIRHPLWLAKGEHSIEQFLYARFHMYWTVYYHKTTRGFESLFETIIRRAKDISAGEGCLPGVSGILKGDLATPDFLLLDDNMMLAQIAVWRQSRDPILQDLSERFLCRDGFKPYGRVVLRADNVSFLEDVKERLRRGGHDPEYYLLSNTRATTAYDYYRFEEEMGEQTPKTSIMLVDEKGIRHEVSHRLPGVAALSREPNENTYYYVPRDLEGELRPILERLLA